MKINQQSLLIPLSSHQSKKKLQSYESCESCNSGGFLFVSWYYKNCTRERSEAILREEQREGCFLVRESSAPGMFTLSLLTTEK